MMTETVSLLVGTYTDERRRAEELIQCLEGNVANPLIEDIHLFVEDPVLQWEAWFELREQSRFPAIDTLNRLRSHRKVTVVPFGRRPFYSEYFEYANRTFPKGRVAILSNSDIEFNETLLALRGRDLDGIFICLARDNGNSGHNPPLSQDSWIFQIPVKAELLATTTWPLGIGGGDHKIAYEAEQAGYRLVNPCHSIRATHRHESRIRTWPLKPNIKGPGRGVDLTGIEVLDGGAG